MSEWERHAKLNSIASLLRQTGYGQGVSPQSHPARSGHTLTHLRVKQIERSEVRTDFVERDHEVPDRAVTQCPGSARCCLLSLVQLSRAGPSKNVAAAVQVCASANG